MHAPVATAATDRRSSLSIISVVRNDQAGLDLTVQSVASECPWAEHLIIDGSDVPLQVVPQPNLRVVFGRDRGISHAFNRGILEARGEFMVFLNAGDDMVPGAGEVLHRSVAESSADCLWFPVYRCYSDGVKAQYRPRLKYLTYAMSAPHQGMVLRRAVFSEIGLFPLQRYSMDHYIALAFLRRRPRYVVELGDTFIANYPAGGHSTKGGSKPFLWNCANVLRLDPAKLPLALVLNLYLALKSKFASS